MPFKSGVHEKDGKWIGEVHKKGSNDPTTGERVWREVFATKEEAMRKTLEVQNKMEALEKSN